MTKKTKTSNLRPIISKSKLPNGLEEKGSKGDNADTSVNQTGKIDLDARIFESTQLMGLTMNQSEEETLSIINTNL